MGTIVTFTSLSLFLEDPPPDDCDDEVVKLSFLVRPLSLSRFIFDDWEANDCAVGSETEDPPQDNDDCEDVHASTFCLVEKAPPQGAGADCEDVLDIELVLCLVLTGIPLDKAPR